MADMNYTLNNYSWFCLSFFAFEFKIQRYSRNLHFHYLCILNFFKKIFKERNGTDVLLARSQVPLDGDLWLFDMGPLNFTVLKCIHYVGWHYCPIIVLCARDFIISFLCANLIWLFNMPTVFFSCCFSMFLTLELM